MSTRKNFTVASITLAALAAACTMGAEVVLIAGAPDLDGAFGVAATLDGTTVFTADGDNILTAFTPSGGTTDWQVDGYDPLVAITVDPATTNGIRVLRESGIVTTRMSGGQIVTDRGTVPLPSGLWSELCDVSADKDGDLYVTGIESFVYNGTLLSWAELHRYDGSAGVWSGAVYLGSQSSCPKVSVDTEGDRVALLRPSDNLVEIRHKDTLTLASSFTESQAVDVDIMGGYLLMGSFGTGQQTFTHTYVRVTDTVGTVVLEDYLSPFPSAVHLSVNSTTGIRAYATGEQMLSYFDITP